MTYDYDLITVGLGPAGMAVSIMGSEMGLNVCGVEKNKIGGECMNVGCIPSKALLRIAKMRHNISRLADYELAPMQTPTIGRPFHKIQEHLNYISEKKTIGMFSKVDMLLGEGSASFVDPHTLQVGDDRISARRIFLCVGTRPAVPDIPGLRDGDILTNENMFHLQEPPESLIVFGGGAIACEMAQAFARLGTQVTMIFRGPRIMWREDPDSTDLIEKTFEQEGIRFLRNQLPVRFEHAEGRVIMRTDAGQTIKAERILVATGRAMDFSSLNLEAAGVQYNQRGIVVNGRLQTSRRHIFACGDCNGSYQFSHAAMHQGMIALMNAMMPWPMKYDYRKFVVPWTVFTEPQFSRAGMNEEELKTRRIRYRVVQVNYRDYGAAIAERVDAGHIKAFVSPLGKIHGVYIVGEGSGEMINEWALAIQYGLTMRHLMFQQHSFPTMGFLTKRASETWMMGHMQASWIKRMCRFMFRM